LNPVTLEKLAAYVGLLDKWNRVYNLTAVRQPSAMVTRHILDSLAVMPFLLSGRLLDIGTGAGLPGLPLAIARSDLVVTLLDSNSKKLRFVRQAVAELGLGHTDVVQARMQEYQPEHAFDMVISRAVSSLEELYRQSQHLLAPGGRMLFMKGTLPKAEVKAFAPVRETLHIERLRVPGLEAQRHLIWLDKLEP
jgi:16S rRNA (guanine527-N7)-methyltransferase